MVLERPVKERFVLKTQEDHFPAKQYKNTPEAHFLNLLFEDQSHRTADKRNVSMPLGQPPRVLLY